MNKTDFYSLTPLQHATEFGHTDVVEYLLKSGLVLRMFIIYLLELEFVKVSK